MPTWTEIYTRCVQSQQIIEWDGSSYALAPGKFNGSGGKLPKILIFLYKTKFYVLQQILSVVFYDLTGSAYSFSTCTPCPKCGQKHRGKGDSRLELCPFLKCERQQCPSVGSYSAHFTQLFYIIGVNISTDNRKNPISV